ncbi:MAG TPA: HD domain-containing protein [Candidatus Humimicrobiaceae bacterium]
MISNDLFLKIFEAASMQRWNDQVRSVEMSELDKQAHKMVAAYVIARLEEDAGNSCVDRILLIRYGLYEYLQRIVLTDLKPPLFYEIKQNREKYLKLNLWVYEKTYPFIKGLGNDFCEGFKDYILSETQTNDTDINRIIINAAHFYVTKWEYDIISRFNPGGYQVEEIKSSIEKEQEKFAQISGVRSFLSSPKLLSFINICGQLRFQVRWSHIYRVPRTSVLGHMLIVAIFTYLFSCAGDFNPQKTLNNYFTGLFHDLPEVLTRDIINPVKKSVEGLDELIKDYEKSEMDKRIYNLLPEKWHNEMRQYTEDEFGDIPLRDGKLVKAADDLAAFIEAYLSIKNGIKNENLENAMMNIRTKYKDFKLTGIDFKILYDRLFADMGTNI